MIKSHILTCLFKVITFIYIMEPYKQIKKRFYLKKFFFNKVKDKFRLFSLLINIF